jgi:hypothetical protein
MNEKGARLGCLAREHVIVPIYIKEMYTGVPENRKSLTVIEFIAADKTAILPVVIVLRWKVIENWFSAYMTGHKLIIMLLLGYTNKGIIMEWLDYFIKHRKCGPDQLWHILLVDGAICYKTP